MAARIDPRCLPTFFQKLLNDQQRSSSRVTQWFSTHPTNEDRIAATRAEIAHIPAAQLRGLRTSSNTYNALKARVRSLPAAPRQVVAR
jgi:predicted Zn-dependent protease